MVQTCNFSMGSRFTEFRGRMVCLCNRCRDGGICINCCYWKTFAKGHKGRELIGHIGQPLVCGGISGVVQGLLLHTDESILGIISGDGSEEAILWWSTFAVFIPIFLVDMAWRMRLIHGGADCKGLMWVAILVPSWTSIPIQFPEAMENSVIAMPPAIALLVWGGLSFLFYL